MTTHALPLSALRVFCALRRALFAAGWAALLPFLAPAAHATTVIPPEFDSLVQQADYVVRGTVKSIASEWRVRNGHRQIITRVEIEVSEIIAGTPPSPLVLQMLGGRIGDDQMIVQGSPKFVVGDEHILFIRGNGVQFNPLVALMHGQYPIKKDAVSGRREMSRSDGSPLRDEKEVALPMHAVHADDGHDESVPSTGQSSVTPPSAATSPALTPEEFATRIRASRQKAASSK